MTQQLLFAVGLLAGGALAYVDSLPSWDDAGLIAGGLFIVSGVLTALGYRRPWLLALAVGIWIPLRGILMTHDARMLLVLLFAIAGAYLGWLIRLGTKRVLPRA